MSKLGKRAVPILIIAIFVLSLLPLTPFAFAAISIDDVDPLTGDKGDTIKVYGSGVTAGVDVNLYWDKVGAWADGKGLLNSTEAESNGEFEIWFDVPEAVYGEHYLWAKDTETGDTTMYEFAFEVYAKLSVDPDTGLPGDKKIEVKGYGFSEEEEIVVFTFGPIVMTPSPREPETDEYGSWSATFTVPDVPYGVYEVYAEDNETVSAVDEFTVGPSITLGPDEGPVGTVVEVEGRGFNGTKVEEITIEIDGVRRECEILDDIEIDDGEFEGEFVIPGGALGYDVEEEEDYEIMVIDDYPYNATEDFEVLGLADVDTDPDFGVQGATIDIEGFNFTADEDVEVVLIKGTEEREVDEYEADANGEFSGTFRIPAVSTGTWDLVAKQEDYYIEATTEFRVGLMIVILSESEGPCGMEVTITGTGFAAGELWNATMGGVTIFEDEDVDGEGSISGEFYVPTLDVGTYTITVMDIEEEVEITVDFEVTDTTYAETDPVSAPNEYNLTISGEFFAEDEGAELEFVLFNSTDEWDITDDVYNMSSPKQSAKLDEDGAFEAWWEVYDDDELDLGCYTLNVTYEEDYIYAQIEFCIVSKTVDIEPSKDTYSIGDTVRFDIVSSFKYLDSYIKIWDPEGDVYWITDRLDHWVKVADKVVAPYYIQTSGGNPMILTSDAPLGTWTWVWIDTDGDDIDEGSFTVVAAPVSMLEEQMQALSDEFDALSDEFSTLSGEISGVSDDLADTTAAVQENKDAIDTLADSVAGVSTKADDAKKAADDAKAASNAAKESADKAGEVAGGLTTLVYGAIAASLVAALAAIVSLMQISRRIAG